MRTRLSKILLVTTALLTMAPDCVLGQAAKKNKAARAGHGTICLGVYAPDILRDINEQDHVYLTVGDSQKIPFDQKPGTIARSGLDPHKTYVVRAFVNDEEEQSWNLRFDRLGASMVTVRRSAHLWRMEPTPSGKCVWPRPKH